MVRKRSEGGNTHQGLKTFTQQRQRTIQPTPSPGLPPIRNNIIKERLTESATGTTNGRGGGGGGGW